MIPESVFSQLNLLFDESWTYKQLCSYNSFIYAISTANSSFVLKLYRNNSLRRFYREIKSFYFLDSCSFSHKPDLLRHSFRFSDQHPVLWSLFSFIPSEEEPISQSLSTSHIYSIYHKLSRLVPHHVPIASDFSASSFSNIHKCRLRLSELKKYLSLSKHDYSCILSLLETLSISLDNSSSLHCYTISDNDLVFSHSDVGFHNILSNSSGTYLIDFEYAGIDDIYKLISDLILNPTNAIYTLSDLPMLSELAPYRFVHPVFISRFYFQFIKWITIYIRRCIALGLSSTPELLFKDIFSYYLSFNSFLDLPSLSYDY